MSLEDAINANTEALKANTAALLGQATTAPAKDTKADAVKADKKAETKKAEPAKEAAPAADAIDYETQVKPRVLAVVKAKGREVMDGLLSEHFGVKSAKELKPEQYASFLEKLAVHEEEDVA